MPEERLTTDELAYLCFGVNDQGDADEIFGDERGAAVMQIQRFGAHVRPTPRHDSPTAFPPGF